METSKFLEKLDVVLSHIQNARGGGRIIIAADSNAKSPLWHSVISDDRGGKLANFIAEKGLVVLNNNAGIPTFENIRGESYIDKTLCTSGLTRLVKSWKVHDINRFDRIRNSLNAQH